MLRTRPLSHGLSRTQVALWHYRKVVAPATGWRSDPMAAGLESEGYMSGWLDGRCQARGINRLQARTAIRKFRVCRRVTHGLERSPASPCKQDLGS